jgi:hypothetical protein
LYCKSTLENDYAEIAAALFTGNPHLWDSPPARLMEKRDCLIAFLSGLDGRLDADYFKMRRGDTGLAVP